MLPEASYRLLIKRQLNELGFVEIPSSGYSMFPSIRPGDVCRFAPITEQQLTVGDVLLFLDEEGKLIGHRLIRIIGANEEDVKFECKGDTNNYPDLTIARNRLLGKLTMIRRMNRRGKRTTIQANQYLFVTWGKLVLRMPYLSSSLRKLALFTSSLHAPHEQRQ